MITPAFFSVQDLTQKGSPAWQAGAALAGLPKVFVHSYTSQTAQF